MDNPDIEFTFSDLKFQNVTFVKYGELIKIRHQTVQPLQINGLTVEDVVGGKIRVEAATSNNNGVLAKVEVRDSRFAWLQEGSNHLFEVSADSSLSVINSTFSQIYSKEKGAVFSADGKGSIKATDCSFEENSATEGAIFLSIQQSLIHFENCQFRRNFAVMSGVGVAELDGYFSFKNATIQENWAGSVLLISVFDTTLDSWVCGSQISNNDYAHI